MLRLETEGIFGVGRRRCDQLCALSHAAADLAGDGTVGRDHESAGQEEQDEEVIELVAAPAQGIAVVPDAPERLLHQAHLHVNLKKWEYVFGTQGQR